MKPRNFAFLILTALSLLIGCASSSSTAKLESSPATADVGSNNTAASIPPVTPEADISGCDSTWKRDAKLKALNSAVERSDLETQSVKDGFTNSTQRSRLAILSAGLIPDDVPFVSLDRSCWSEFYRAHQGLREGNEKLAKKAAEGWRICLVANFPERSKMARNLFRCFGLSETADDDAAE